MAYNEHSFPYFFKVWHYHEELELVLITKSVGTYFIGDEIDSFKPGDLFLIGSNVPHMLLNDKEYFLEDSELRAEALVIHFDKKLIQSDIFNLLEASKLKPFLQDVDRAIKFSPEVAQRIKRMMKQLPKRSDFERILMLLRLLEELSQDKDYHVVGSSGFSETYNGVQKKRMGKVYDYIFNNFKEPIALDTLAELSSMNKSSFCRYFKKHNGKTVSRYVNEIRVGYACKLLHENKLSISEICYESGYNNISNFNRQFRNLKGMSPSEFLGQYG
jgi:AraC-like DNA-binding protein